MKNEIINKLPEELREHKCSLKKASKDDANSQHMCDSLIEVVNFDKIPTVYAKGKGWSGVPLSNDALYIESENLWHFIEFKNGEVKKHEVYRKIYDSLIMLVEMNIIPNLEFSRKHITYTLVYNSDKYSRAKKSVERDKVYGHTRRMAKKERMMFEIEKFEKYLFSETHTYTVDEFNENFVSRIEKFEGEDTE